MARNTIAVMTSGFNYFAPFPIQNSIDERVEVEISPVNAIQPGVPFEFFAMGGEGEALFLDLPNSYFKFQVRVQTSGGANPDDAAELSCVQNLGHSMFSRIEPYFNDRLMSDANNLYPLRAYISALFNRSKIAQDHEMYEQGFFGREPAGKRDNFKTTTDNKPNTAAILRQKIIGKGAKITLIMRPELEIFHLDKYIIPGIKFRIRFTPAQSAFILKRGAGNDAAKFEITDAKFYCNFVKATKSQTLGVIEEIRNRKFVEYRTTHLTLKPMTIATGSLTANLDNIFLGPIPNRIFMCMTTDAANGGSYDADPFNFQHFNLNYLCLYVNGKMYPTSPYQPDFTNNDYIREYHDLLKNLNRSYSPFPIALTAEEFGQGYTIFVTDLTPDKNCEQTHSPQGSGTVRVMLRFSQALTTAITLYTVAEFDSSFQIDEFKNVATQF